MLTDKQISEIRAHLEKAQNPVFYYDNDADGLCSYVLLRRFLERGYGVAVRSFPDLNKDYARKARELKADYVFVLDKHALSEDFLKEIREIGLPIVWIDHHDVPQQEQDKKTLWVYNSSKSGDKKGEPVTYICYKVTGKKEDSWLGVVGCISDHYLPDFSLDFQKEYPDFWGKVEKPFDALYGTEIGKIAMALNFGLKDSTTNIVKLQNFLINRKNPGEVLEEVKENYYFRKKYTEIKKKYDELLKKAKKSVGEKMVFFEYSGDLSISSEVSNELSYLYSGKYIVVAYKKQGVVNLSLRGKGVKKILEKILEEIKGSGGGHEDAVGARINLEDLGRFKELVEKEIEENEN